jgi:probable rRNA maturation factor
VSPATPNPRSDNPTPKNNGLSIDLRIADPRWDMLGDIDAFAAHVLGLASARMGQGGEIAILLTNDAEMHALNRQWRGMDKPTDVLSFQGESPEIPGQPQYLGDVAVGFDTALRDAEAMQRPFDGHVSHLLVHGFLHLLGYDHIEADDAKVMEPLEAEILAGLGWPDPYNTGPYAAGLNAGRQEDA